MKTKKNGSKAKDRWPVTSGTESIKKSKNRKRSMTMRGFRGKRFRTGVASRRGPGRRHKK